MRATPPRKRISERRSFGVAFIAALLLSFACKSPQPSPPAKMEMGERVAGRRGGSLTYRVATPPQTFNYILASDEPSLIVAFYLTGGRLVEFDHEKRGYVPGVAESWKLADDGRTVDVTLRDRVKFSDGAPLTADDVEFTFRALYDKRTASPAFSDAMKIEGRPIEVSIVDPRHLRLLFPAAIAAPENYLSNLAVLPRHVLESDFNDGKFGDAYSLKSDPQRIVTAGPFAIHSTTPAERVELRRNPHYWKTDGSGTPLPYLDGLIVEVVSDANNAITRLSQVGLDLYDRIRSADYAALASSKGPVFAFDLGPGLQTDHVCFNLALGKSKNAPASAKSAWFADSRFRRAVSHAIDRQTIASVTLQGLATPLYGFVSPGNRAWVADNLKQTGYDLEVSRTLLSEAGFTTRGPESARELFDARGNRVEFTMMVPVESAARVTMATVIQENLKGLGIKMQVAPIEFGEFGRRMSSGDYDVALFGASPTEPDPSSYVNFLLSSSKSNQWNPRQSSPATEWEKQIDDLVAAQANERNVERRRESFRQIQTILAEQLPIIPIVSRHLASAANQRTR